MPLDSIAVLSLLDRATNAAGEVLPGATLEFYDAGTTTPKTVYADTELTISLGAVVTCDSGGYPSSNGNAVSIYTGTGTYKVVVKDADGVTVLTRDNVRGASEIPTSENTALPVTPVVSKTSTSTIVTDDRSKLINCDPTGGSFAITLPSAATVGDGWKVGIRHAGASTQNVVTIRSTGGQTISIPGQASATACSLRGLGETIWLTSNGTSWTGEASAPPFMKFGVPLLTVKDRRTSPPTSPVGGARYLVNGSPAGAWAATSIQDEDIVEANGNGGWMRYRARAGWLVYIESEQLYTHFDGANWVDLSNVEAPTSSALKYLSVNDTQATNTAGGTATSGSWAARTLNTSVANTITGASLGSNQITLPAGKYFVTARGSFYRTGNTKLRLKSTTTSTELVSPNVSVTYYIDGAVTVGVGTEIMLSGFLNLSAQEVFELQYYCSRTQATDGLGVQRNVGSESEVYAEVSITDLTAIQGPEGDAGPQGAAGRDGGLAYVWSTVTSGDPGSGKIRGNSATIASITEIGISKTDALGANHSATLALWDDSTSGVRAVIRIHKHAAGENYHVFKITGSNTDGGSYRTFPVTYVGTGGTIANSDDVTVSVAITGDAGATGATGPNTGLDYEFNTATSGDPGSGKIGYNTATPGSVATVRISKTGRNGESLGTLIGAWDDATNTAYRGTLRIFSLTNRARFVELAVTGAMTDNTTYWSVPVQVEASGSIHASGDVLAVMFVRAGSGGGAGATGPNTGLDYQFSTSTSGDPGVGRIAFNAATPGSVTQVNISKTGRNGEALSAFIATWDDSTNPSVRGHLRIFTVSDKTKFAEAWITSAMTASANYWSIPVTVVASGSLPSADDVMAVMFTRAGDSATDDLVLAYDDATDDAPALNAALNNAGGRVIKLRPGTTIRLATAISTTGKSWVLDARGANIHVDADVAAITAMPGTSALQNVSAVSGAVVTVSDGTAYSVGDWIRVISDDVPLDAETQVSGSNIQSLGEPNRILSISGNDLTCERDFYYAAQFVTTVRCFKIGTPSVHIIGGHWYFTQGQAWTNPMFQIIGLIHPRIEGVRISRGYAQGIKLVGTISAVIDTVHIGGLSATGGTIGYGISDNGYYTTVLNATGAYGRDLFTTSNSTVAPGATGEASLHGHGHSVGCQVIGARGVGFANACVDSHHTTRDATFRDIYAEDTAYAVTCRGKNMRIDGVNGHNVGSMVYVFTELYNPPTTDGVEDEDGWTSDVFVSNIFGNTNGRFLEVVKAQRVVYGGVMRGSCKRIDAIRIRDATVECAADIDITITDTAGTDGVIGMIDVLQSGTLGSTFDPIFKQMPGSRIRLDATGSTYSTGFQIVRSGQASHIILDGEVDAILPPSSVGPAFVSWDTPAGELIAKRVKYDVAGGGESGVTLSSGTVTIHAISADGSNNRGDVGAAEYFAGTYTPTLTNTTNVSSSTAYLCHYLRVVNTVTVSGRLDVTPTAAASTATTLGISLPVASNFSNAVQCTGSAATSNIVSVAAGIAGSSGSDRAIVIWLSSSTSSHEMYFTFSYQVLP